MEMSSWTCLEGKVTFGPMTALDSSSLVSPIGFMKDAPSSFMRHYQQRMKLRKSSDSFHHKNHHASSNCICLFVHAVWATICEVKLP